jgi:hypothetical protein
MCVNMCRERKSCRFIALVVIGFILFHQFFNIYIKSVRFEQQSQLISHLNSTWVRLKDEHNNVSSKSLSNLRTNMETTRDQIQRVSNRDTNSLANQRTQSRDLKPLSIFSTKRAVLFTMDSIGSCKIYTPKQILLPPSFMFLR